MDFNSISNLSGKSSMKRKQSNSLLHAFGKPASRASAIPFTPNAYTSTPPTASSSHFPDTHDVYSTDSGSSPYTETSSTRHTSSSYNLPLHSSRSVSGTTSVGSGSRDGKGGGGGTQVLVIRRPEDVQKIAKARMLSWSYMSQWYQGDIHWFNTVRVLRTQVESSIGQLKVDQRARHFHLLGMSLGTLMDISNAMDFLRNLLKILDEWESVVEGNGKGVKGLFRGQRSAKKSMGGGGVSDIATGLNETETSLAYFNIPFPPDFFLAHAMTCDIISDLYKKFTRMVLPSNNPPAQTPLPNHAYPSTSDNNLANLIHPSTIIRSASYDSPSSNPLSPASASNYSFHGGSNEGTGNNSPEGYDPIGSSVPATPESWKNDAFQAYVAGQLPGDRKLVGEGQKLTSALIEQFMKADQKLRKIYSTLMREGDALARKVLDDELALLTASLYSGPPLNFDYGAALSGAGSGLNGVYGAEFINTVAGMGDGMSPVPSLVSSRGGGQWEDTDPRERSFGTV